MGRMLLGGLVAILFLCGGIFLWRGFADAPGPAIAAAPPPDHTLPVASDEAAGAPPPDVPTANPRTREQKRFDRYDRNRDGIITRVEMLSTRSAAFRRLDKDGNNLLSFEEWAVATSDRFAGADADGDGRLTATEFATTAPRRRPQRQNCNCVDSREREE